MYLFWCVLNNLLEAVIVCRIGSIKSKVPVSPAKALKLMIPQQEGHDNSGFAMVMKDLYGIFPIIKISRYFL